MARELSRYRTLTSPMPTTTPRPPSQRSQKAASATYDASGAAELKQASAFVGAPRRQAAMASDAVKATATGRMRRRTPTVPRRQRAEAAQNLRSTPWSDQKPQRYNVSETAKQIAPASERIAEIRTRSRGGTVRVSGE